MGEQRGRRVVGGMVALLVPAAVVALVIVLGVTLWGRGDLNALICDGDCGPANVVPPAALALDDVPRSATPDAPDAGAVDPAKLEAAVAPGLDDAALGPHVGFAAVGADGTPLYGSGAGTFAPASTTKVLTGYAALATIDPATRYSTTVVRSADGIVLVGGGDPYLATKPRARGDDRVFQADLTTLARRTAKALTAAGTTTVTLGYDASLFTGPDASPAWESSYVSADIVTRISALWTDQGVSDAGAGLADDPAGAAARTFARLLADESIDVEGDPSAATAGAGAEVVAEVRSATLAQIVETLVRVSDNEAAEVVLRHVGLAAGGPGSFDGGTAAVKAALTAGGIATGGLVLNDGSGLSRDNRIAPATLAQTLQVARQKPRTSGLLADLPVSGFTGTLVGRFADLKAARGTVRAKTGTLSGIHSLAGYALDADARPVIFAVMSDRSDRDLPLQAQAALDRVAAAIATCSCGGRE